MNENNITVLANSSYHQLITLGSTIDVLIYYFVICFCFLKYLPHAYLPIIGALFEFSRQCCHSNTIIFMYTNNRANSCRYHNIVLVKDM